MNIVRITSLLSKSEGTRYKLCQMLNYENFVCAMKVDLMPLISGAHGKWCKKDANSPIFAQNKVTGVNYAYHIHSPFTGEASDAQKAAKQKFASAATQTQGGTT